MKTISTIIFILLLTLTTLVFAQETYLGDSTEEKIQDTLSKTGEILTQGIATAGEEANRADDISTPLPSFLETYTKKIFKIEGSIDLEYFILLWLTLILIFIATLEILGFTAFETTWVKYTITTAITFLATLFGGSTKLANSFVNISNTITFFTKIGSWSLFFWIIIGTTIIILLKRLRKKIQKTSRIDEAKSKGKILGSVIKGAEGIAKATAKE